MAFSEKLYALRKKSGLSQEQLAERLNVSRQAISKWESGQSVPESEKLLAVSGYFGVSLDYLMKEDEEAAAFPADGHTENFPPAGRNFRWMPGSILCVGGAVCLIIWGLLSLMNPKVSAQLSESARIQIDGNGVFLLLSAAAILAGAVLLLKGTTKK